MIRKNHLVWLEQKAYIYGHVICNNFNLFYDFYRGNI